MERVTHLDIDRKYYPALGRIFSPIVLDNIIQNRYSPYLSEVLLNSNLYHDIDLSISLGNFFDYLFHLLLKNYKNEYVYKSAIANKILLGRHSLNTSHMLTEFRVGKNKADVVILNGTSTVYEIKSEYDSFARIEAQIESYMQAFDYINVIVSPTQVDKVSEILPSIVGILSFTEKNTITTIRKAESNLNNIELRLLFHSLRKKEYLQIVKAFYGTIPNLPNTIIHQACEELYCNIPFSIAHKLTISALKERNSSAWMSEYIQDVPHSLTAYVLSIAGKRNKIRELSTLLNKELSYFLTPHTI